MPPGKVLDGMEEADRIVSVKRNYMDRPKEEQIMREVMAETFGKRMEKLRRYDSKKLNRVTAGSS